MLTAKKFKDLGVNFVDGDKMSDQYGIPYTYKGSSLWKGWLTYKMDFFAWRPLSTLPYNPKFKYEQDFSQAEIRWRPLLDQSDAKVGEPTKPVFTQAMADAGELPPVGSLFRIHKHNYIMVGISSLGSVVGEHCEFSEYKGFHAKDCKPIDNRTPKQKAVDDLKTEILNFYGYNDGDGYKSLSEYLNERGYRKDNKE